MNRRSKAEDRFDATCLSARQELMGAYVAELVPFVVRIGVILDL